MLCAGKGSENMEFFQDEEELSAEVSVHIWKTQVGDFDDEI